MPASRSTPGRSSGWSARSRAGTIERLVGEVARRADIAEENVEIVPGLIIIHRSDAAAGYPETAGDEDEAWSRPFAAGAAETGETDASESELAGAV